MEKKIFFWVCGLMSLLTLSSCEDKITFNEGGEFLPIGYTIKTPENLDEFKEMTTLQIMGIKGLIFDTVEKSDWKIITWDQAVFNGSEPLEFYSNNIEIENLKGFVNVPTNYGDIPVAFGNTDVEYTYLGEQVKLQPLETFRLFVKVELEGESSDESKSKDGPFIQYGHIVYTLSLGNVPIKTHKHQLLISELVNKEKETKTE